MALIVPSSGVTESWEYANLSAALTATGFTSQVSTTNTVELVTSEHNRGSKCLKFTRLGANTGSSYARVAKGSISSSKATFGVSLFFKIDPASALESFGLIRIENAGGAVNLAVGADKVNKLWYLQTTNYAGTTYTEASPYSTIVPGVWYQVIFSTSGWGGATITPAVSINGITAGPVNTFSGAGFADVNPTTVTIGIVRQDNAEADSGLILYVDDVRIQDDTALLPVAQIIDVKAVRQSGGDAIVVACCADSVTGATVEYGASTAYGSIIIPDCDTDRDSRILTFTLPESDDALHYRLNLTGANYTGDTLTTADYSVPGAMDDADVDVLIIGDVQNYAKRCYAAWKAVSSGYDPDLVLQTGDFTAIQDNTKATWDGYTFAQKWPHLARNLTVPSYWTSGAYWASVVGNHDYVGQPGTDAVAVQTAAEFKSYVPVPVNQDRQGRWWSFDLGRAHFVCVADMGSWPISYTMPAEFWPWLQADLAHTHQQWKIVLQHFHCYWSPDDPEDALYPGTENAAHYATPERDDFHAYYKAGGVNLVIQGHRHAWNRYNAEGVMYATICDTGASAATAAFYNRTSDADVSPGQGSLVSVTQSGGYATLGITEHYLKLTYYDRDGALEGRPCVIRPRAGNRYPGNARPFARTG